MDTKIWAHFALKLMIFVNDILYMLFSCLRIYMDLVLVIVDREVVINNHEILHSVQ